MTDRATLRFALIGMVRQFGYQDVADNVPVLHSGGLSALEDAFAALNWTDPEPFPEEACEHDGCGAWATCGVMTADEYQRLCGDHYLAEKARVKRVLYGQTCDPTSEMHGDVALAPNVAAILETDDGEVTP